MTFSFDKQTFITQDSRVLVHGTIGHAQMTSTYLKELVFSSQTVRPEKLPPAGLLPCGYNSIINDIYPERRRK